MKLIMIGLLFVMSSCQTRSVESQDRAKLRMQLGVSNLQRGNYPQALKELLAAEKEDPQSPLVHNNLGLIYFLLEKYNLAIDHFSKAYDADSNFTDAKNNLARVYIEIKKFDQAESELKIVQKDLTYSNPNKTFMNWGLLEFNRNRFQEAKKFFKRVLDTERENCYAYVFLGRSSLELSEYKIANDILEKGSHFCQKSLIDDAHYYSAITAFRQGDKNLSLTKFKELRALFPDGKNYEQSAKMIKLIEKGTL